LLRIMGRSRSALSEKSFVPMNIAPMEASIMSATMIIYVVLQTKARSKFIIQHYLTLSITIIQQKELLILEQQLEN